MRSTLLNRDMEIISLFPFVLEGKQVPEMHLYITVVARKALIIINSLSQYECHYFLLEVQRDHRAAGLDFFWSINFYKNNKKVVFPSSLELPPGAASLMPVLYLL